MKYVIIIAIILIALFSFLFFQRKKEIVLVRKAVSDFIFSVNKKENYRQYLQDNFIKIFEDDIYKTAPYLFDSPISSIDEGIAGEYKVSTDTGKTFVYKTNINYSHGDSAELTAKLRKKEDQWLIYGLSIAVIVSDKDKNDINQTVNNLFQSIKDDKEYDTYLNPKFVDIFKSQLLDKFPGNFKEGVFSDVYTVGKFKNEAMYSNIISYGENKLNLNVKLTKVGDDWLIYSIEFN